MEKHIKGCKEDTDQFLYDLIFELEDLFVKYSSKLNDKQYRICEEALNEVQQVITLLKIWRQRLNER